MENHRKLLGGWKIPEEAVRLLQKGNISMWEWVGDLGGWTLGVGDG